MVQLSTFRSIDKTQQLLASVFRWLPRSKPMDLVDELAQNRLAGLRVGEEVGSEV